MIFKVFYQESKKEVPVREKTQTIYVEGESERDIRLKLADKPYNIEFITAVEGNFLEFEKQSEDFNVLEIG
ncbi:DNA-dependent RNA polymerase subunit epsilon [Bacillus sp. S/N-304-OC-R1]|uniref:DNA-dependent RNA polymerase subunit epsilon n=1 Tax=Bacillus sp. S/N-304-OC-R1 TaxID=2758034 RepID=UPI001C8DB056|nr:DNA-directed RNA polymerase subunit epsilon [Bacillus sp. S/N-304-OC-R1]MBY0120874.1 DNA-dependent RNA polymerase auxiliary subunit epsilon family protein [Bacillus sp. S/N-304-OC-R1]